MTKRRCAITCFLPIAIFLSLCGQAWAEQSHAAFTDILEQTVTWNELGTSTAVDYQQLKTLRPALDQY